MQVPHEITVAEQDHSYDLTCVCGWTYTASVAQPSEDEPERNPQSYAIVASERHLIANGIWPYTAHGKPEVFNKENQKVVILEDWPFNK